MVTTTTIMVIIGTVKLSRVVWCDGVRRICSWKIRGKRFVDVYPE